MVQLENQPHDVDSGIKRETPAIVESHKRNYSPKIL
jgi:hypothetical protein